MSKYVKMFMGTRENFDRSVKKDGLKEASVYLNADTGELYFVYEDKEPVRIDLNVDFDNVYQDTVEKLREEIPEIPDTFSGNPSDWEDLFKPLEF